MKQEDANKVLIRRYFDALNSGDLDTFGELFATDFRLNGARLAGNSPGPEGMKHHSTLVTTAFPDRTATLHDIIAEGDKVVVRWTLTGTHRGPFRGITATGRPVRPEFIDIFRVEAGRIAERWTEGDRLGLLQQVGAIAQPVP